MGLCWGTVNKNPLANTGDMGLIPGLVSASEQLTPYTTTSEPVLSSPQATTTEAPACLESMVCNKRSPHIAARESLCAATKAQHNQK